MALADKNTPQEEMDYIEVPPKTFALKKVHEPEVLDAAVEILSDRRIITGITPMDTIDSLISIEDRTEVVPVEVMLYVLVSYAIAIQQKWIRYVPIMHRYYVNPDSAFAVEYAQDIHGQFLQ